MGGVGIWAAELWGLVFIPDSGGVFIQVKVKNDNIVNNKLVFS